MALSSIRLAHLASYYSNEEYIYDIGCDHGLLGLSFLSYPRVKEIHLIDPNPYSVDIINKYIDADIPEHVKIKTSKISGEKTKVHSAPSLIFIAGMGGKNIRDILKAWSAEELKRCQTLVLSPHRNHLELRTYLIENGFYLRSETVIFEGSNFYEVLVVTKEKTEHSITPYGKDVFTGETGRKYLDHQMGYLVHHRDFASQTYLNYLKTLV